MEFDLSNQVIARIDDGVKSLPRRSLDLGNVRTPELGLLSPQRNEIAPKGPARATALIAYSDRLRSSYKSNERGLRDGMLMLAQTLRDGQTISVSCLCRAGEMCHADVVKMAIEKVRDQIKIREAAERSAAGKARQSPETQRSNPRTLRAISEILSVSTSDMLLAKIDSTEGRSRSEHASYLNKYSQLARDLYERGAIARDGVLISPKETQPKIPASLTIATNEYAVNKLERILDDHAKAKELAPIIVEHGKMIAGATADRETQVKVFTWMYDSLEGHNDLLPTTDKTPVGEIGHVRFDRTLGEIARLAEEMNRLEPTDRFVPLDEHEQQAIKQPTETSGDDLSPDEIYWNMDDREHLPVAPGTEISGAGRQEFDRVDLGNATLARLAASLPKKELERWFEVRLPALDREIESGKPVSEILKTFQEVVYQTAKNDPSNKQAARDDLQFTSAYIDHQLKQPESRLRHFNPRYRNYASMLESASSRSEVIDIASRIRQENALVGLEREKLSPADRAKTQRPLTSREMQFLFTEVSPRHYTAEMTAARLTYSHAGESRRMAAKALIIGEIQPSPEARSLIVSLEERLDRRYLADSIAATKHFLESIRKPDGELRYKNSFDHMGTYRKLPPPEKDFVYQRAVEQKGTLESRLAARSSPQLPGAGHPDRTASVKHAIPEMRQPSFIREAVKSDLVELFKSKPAQGGDLIGRTNDILEANLAKANSSGFRTGEIQTMSREIGEKIESGLRSAARDDREEGFTRTNSNYRPDNDKRGELASELHQTRNERSSERVHVR